MGYSHFQLTLRWLESTFVKSTLEFKDEDMTSEKVQTRDWLSMTLPNLNE